MSQYRQGHTIGNRLRFRIGLILNLALIQVLSFTLSNAQDFEIQARVVDNADFLPVSFATVFIGEDEGTITDDQGFFRLRLSKSDLKDSIYLSCIGYTQTSVAIDDLNRNLLDTIYMNQFFVELEEVLVHTKKRKAPNAKQILKKTIDSIPYNYPADPVKFRGYYREYVKQEYRYLNLLESIVELEDPGIMNPDDFSSGLLYKRNRSEYEIKEQLIIPYDNVYKFIPYSNAPTRTGNELVVLRRHDPVRNYNEQTLYFKDDLETDFIRHHKFGKPKLTYLNERPYYRIDFKHKRETSFGST
ncbi:carboxypeptidase-like regulatory domain-containing protein, partial [Bacteroidota bacterium]